MPAKPSASAAAAKSTSKSTAKAAKSGSEPVAAPETPKTVKVSKPAGTHAAQVTRRTAIDPRPAVSIAERDRLIAEAAYYRAESRGFAPGDEQADWFAAAQEVDGRYRVEG